MRGLCGVLACDACELIGICRCDLTLCTLCLDSTMESLSTAWRVLVNTGGDILIGRSSGGIMPSVLTMGVTTNFVNGPLIGGTSRP